MLPSFQVHCVVLLRAAQSCALHSDLRKAKQHLDDATKALPCSRALPNLYAQVAVERCRIIRHLATKASAPTDSEAAAAECRTSLCAALHWATLDGGNDWRTIKACMLEFASWFLGSQKAGDAGFALDNAHATATKFNVLMHKSDSLTPVTAAEVPDWLALLVKGQERFFAVANGIITPDQDVTVADADLGRMAVCQMAAIVRNECRSSIADMQTANAQMLQLHTALKGACAKYASDCCFAAPPLPPDNAPEPAEGELPTIS